jgi:hypothetical protein
MASDKAEPQTVSEKIIDKFLQTLAAEKGFEETAVRLRKAVLEDKSTSEKSIRDALFGESDA